MVLVTKDRVLAKLHDNDTLSKSRRIIIPREAQHPSFLATVFAVGPAQTNVKVGDTIVVSNTAGIEVPIKDEKYLVLDNFELLAVVEDGAEFLHDDDVHAFYRVATLEYYECACGKTKRVKV